MKKKYIILGIIAILLLAIIGKCTGVFSKPVGVKVAVEKPQQRTITEIIPANGKIQPVTEVKISPDVSGEIVELYIKEGDKVERGQLLLKIKPDVYVSLKEQAEAQLSSAKARYEQSKAQYIQAEQDYKRNLELKKEKVISDSEFEAIVSKYEMAKEDAEAARYNVSSAQASLKKTVDDLVKTTIYAPMHGTVSKLSVEKGERVLGTVQMAGTEMLRIANLQAMEVLVDVNENDIVRVKLNDTAIVEVDAYPERKFKGVVTQIANSAKNIASTTADQVTNFEVKVLLSPESYDESSEGGSAIFLPGMSASVSIQTRTAVDVLSIPIQAVTTRTDLDKPDTTANSTGKKSAATTKVFVLQSDNTVKPISVKTGIQDNSFIEVIGLEAADEVVTAPYNAISRQLKDGSLVEKTSPDKLFDNKKR